MSNTGVIVSDNEIGGNLTINGVQIGYTAEQLIAALQSQGLLASAELAGLQRHTIIRLARPLRTDIADFEQALVELERAVDIAVGLIARGEHGTDEDTFVDAVLARVADKIRNDDLDGIAVVIDEALAELEAQQRQFEVKQRLRHIALLEEAIRVDTLRRDASSVAQRFESIVALGNPGVARPAWHNDFLAGYAAYLKDGEQKGINFSLSVAVELSHRMLATAQSADERGGALNSLGNALQVLGGRGTGTESLQEAVEAYRAALKELTRNRVPLDWAFVQSNLGAVLQVLGERETGLGRLQEAVEAYRAALKELTSDRSPLPWAGVHNNLGNVLQTLGQRENSVERLGEAVQAFRTALKVLTRDRIPLQWAMTHNNLSNVLQELGIREDGTKRLKEAVVSSRAALEEWTRDRAPFDWATAQNNLGNALARLGERQSGTECLEEALQAYRAALEEWTRERVPLDWASTQNNIGNVLRKLGEREGGTARLKEAVKAQRSALEERTRERVPLDWAMTQNNIGNALVVLGRRESSIKCLQEAVEAFDLCLEVVQEVWPPAWIEDLFVRRNQVFGRTDD